MEEWIAHENIARLKRKLAASTMRKNQAELRRQLAEQEASLKASSPA